MWAHAGVRHIMFSSGPPCVEMTGGEVNMKAMQKQYARSSGAFSTVTAINTAYYLEDFLDKAVAPVSGGFPHFPDADSVLTFRVPHWGSKDSRVPFLGVRDDYGDIMHGIKLNPS
ncbi:hypothetical protein HBI73_217200 [Parastagonospora nodorum]|nr:hypothetical protein HBI06_242840 [Parastagonospora nodorum]KAH4224488.1 hypothetical protein HBI05_235100 [Parastagonospora nodorum]KAH4894651.1 hypothetical protein HBI80_229150 [Parastagonospora nodorum]KAH5005129.1 hypothetical protein HBI75_228820 [Parastagonospora nodorum]KAH5057156.1 hypothetical protein HBI73_217200 [Parastagonospora nodorum]